MYLDDVERTLEAAMADIRKRLTDQADDEVANFLVEAEWDEVRAWLTNLEAERRKQVLLQVMHVLSNAVDAGMVGVVFEQDDWGLEEADQEETGFEPERGEDLTSVNVFGTAEIFGMNDDILFLKPKNKRRDGRAVQVMLTPNA